MSTSPSHSRHYELEFFGTHPDSSGFFIRVAQQEDLAELVEILASSFHSKTGVMRWLFPLMRLGIYEDMRQRLRSQLASGYVCLVAGLESSASYSYLVGTVEIALRSNSPFQIHSAHYPYLSNLAVHPESRRQGVAKRLLAACEDWTIGQGVRTIYLHVLESNHEAKQLYLKSGYQVIGADPLWCCWLLKRPRRLLLHKRLG